MGPTEMLVAAVMLAAAGLWVWMIVDAIRTQGKRAWYWVPLLVVFSPLAMVAYLIWRYVPKGEPLEQEG